MESPNHGGLFDRDLPDTIVVHYTAGRLAESSVKTLCDPRIKASPHLVIGREGSITQLVPFNTIAWHAGKSSYGGRSGFNRYAVGIEIDNAGRLTKEPGGYTAWFANTYPQAEVVEAVHRNESIASFWHRYTEEQIDLVLDICIDLAETYGISMILGHEEISPGRKVDPGPAFPLDKLREKVLQRDRSVERPAEDAPRHDVGMITVSKLNIRSAPRLDAGLVAPPLARGTVVDIFQEINGWYEVEVTTRGWVKAEYVKV